MIVIKVNYTTDQPIIKVNYDDAPIYISTSVDATYINVDYGTGGGGGGGAIWGDIIGNLSDQLDLQAALDDKVPYTGATGDVDLGEYELKAGQIELDQTPTGTAGVAVTRWNDTIGSTETTLKGGNVILKNGVDLVARIVNKVTPNTTLTKAAYQAVRISGAQGQRLAVAFAQANNDNNSADTIGLVTETIATNQEGFIMTVGSLEGINTTGSLQGETWTDGDVLYLSPTVAGAITNVKPIAPQHLVVIGYVEYAHANNGKIYVKVMNGWELGELHDVDTTGATNGQVLKYNGSIWTPQNDLNTGTVTSVDLSAPTGFVVSGNPITSSGTLALSFASGYSLPTTIKQGNWDDAYTFVSNFPTQSGNSGKYLTTDGSTLSWGTVSTANIYNSDGTLTGNRTVTMGGYKLNFAGQVTVNNGSNDALIIKNAVSTYSCLLFRIFGGNAMIASSSDTGSNFLPIAFFTTDTERMRLTSAGRLLLGTTTESTYLLDVNGTGRIKNTLTIYNGGGISFDDGSSPFYTHTIKWSNFDGVTTQSVIGKNSWSVNNSTINFYNSLTGNPDLTIQTSQTRARGKLTIGNSDNSIEIGSFDGYGLYFGSTLFNSTQYKIATPNATTYPSSYQDLYIYGGVGSGGNYGDIFLQHNTTSKAGNVIIGDNTRTASAIVSIASTTQGFLPPRMTAAQKTAISTPATGLVIYQTDSTEGLYQYKSTGWEAIGGGGTNIYNSDGTLTGNRTVTSGGYNLTFTGSNTAASALATGIGMTHTLVAAANNDVLVGLDINPTFTNGAFTGVNNYAARLSGILRMQLKSIPAYGLNIGVDANSGNPWLQGINTSTGNINLNLQPAGGYVGIGYSYGGNPTEILDIKAPNDTGIKVINQANNNVQFALRSMGNNGELGIFTTSTGSLSQRISVFGNGNTVIGGTTDAGYKLDVQGTTRLNGVVTLSGGTGGTNSSIYGSAGNGLVLYAGQGSVTDFLVTTRSGASAISLSNLTGLSMLAALIDNVKVGGLLSETSLTRNGTIGLTLSGYNSATNFSVSLVNSGIAGLFVDHSARVKIGLYTDTFNNSAILDIVSTNKGFLPPRMTETQKNAISTPATGLVIYQTDGTEGLYQYKSTGWSQVAGTGGGGGISRSVNVISTTTTAGASASTDYVYLISGTTTLTLPTAVGNTNRYTLKNVGTNTVTINTTSSQTIDGSTSITMAVRYTALDVISDGTNWNII